MRGDQADAPAGARSDDVGHSRASEPEARHSRQETLQSSTGTLCHEAAGGDDSFT
jgi:hypothetical protein